jgi:hypothetical protein
MSTWSAGGRRGVTLFSITTHVWLAQTPGPSNQGDFVMQHLARVLVFAAAAVAWKMIYIIPPAAAILATQIV